MTTICGKYVLAVYIFNFVILYYFCTLWTAARCMGRLWSGKELVTDRGYCAMLVNSY
jgi:hypothetical protein